MEKLQAFHGALNLNADAVRKGRISNGNLGSAKKTKMPAGLGKMAQACTHSIQEAEGKRIKNLKTKGQSRLHVN